MKRKKREELSTGTSPSGFDDARRLGSLISQLLRQRPDLTRDSVMGLVEEKKKKVGGGYLTDQGALFLVASELGVALTYNHAGVTRLADVTATDASSISVVGRILSISPPKSFTRKTDSKQGVLARIIIYDDSSTMPVSLWDGKAALTLGGVRPGDLIKISSGYLRTGIDGAPVLNVGEKGNVEKIEDKDSEITPISNRAVPPELVIEPARFLAVRGKVKGQVRRSSFGRSDGSSGNMLSFTIGSESNDSKSELRVVIWDNPNPSFQSLRDGEQITLLNVRVRTGRRAGDNFAPSTEEPMEIHGDETTCILEYVEETLHWMKKASQGLFDVSPSSSGGSQALMIKNSIANKGTDLIPFVGRVLSIGEKTQDGSSLRILLVDSQKRKLSVTLSKDSVMDALDLKVDDVVVCKPDTPVDYLGFKASCSKKGSIMKTTAKRDDIPKSNTLVKKIEKLEDPPAIVTLEVMSLSESVSKEIQTKDGLVRRSELQVGDETGEIRLFAWRDLSKLLEKIPAGEHIHLSAVEVQSHEGRKFLNLKNYSKITRNLQ